MTKPYYEHAGITIYHGDCREVLPLILGDVLLTDPDYGVGMKYGRRQLTSEDAESLLTEALSCACIKSQQGLIFWAGSWRKLRKVEDLVEAAGWIIKHFGVWYKPNGAGASGNGLARRFETWFWLTKIGAPSKRSEWTRLPDCIEVSRVHRRMDEGINHPSQKPLELMRRLIRFMSMPGDVIVDPFMGSGTTLRAAKDLGRPAIGIEIEERYCEMAVKRLAQEAMGKLFG